MATLRKAVLTAIVKSLLRGKSLLQAILAYWIRPLGFDKKSKQLDQAAYRSIQDFLKEAEAAILGPVSGDGLHKLSKGLKKQYLRRLQNDIECMLPSYSHQLPDGRESGQYLALDVGGSTLRVALVALSGTDADGQRHSEILRMRNFKINMDIKDLEGTAFFDWMAERICETLEGGFGGENSPDKPLPMAMAWSFPIE